MKKKVGKLANERLKTHYDGLGKRERGRREKYKRSKKRRKRNTDGGERTRGGIQVRKREKGDTGEREYRRRKAAEKKKKQCKTRSEMHRRE